MPEIDENTTNTSRSPASQLIQMHRTATLPATPPGPRPGRPRPAPRTRRRRPRAPPPAPHRSAAEQRRDRVPIGHVTGDHRHPGTEPCQRPRPTRPRRALRTRARLTSTTARHPAGRPQRDPRTQRARTTGLPRPSARASTRLVHPRGRPRTQPPRLYTPDGPRTPPDPRHRDARRTRDDRARHPPIRQPRADPPDHPTARHLQGDHPTHTPHRGAARRSTASDAGPRTPHRRCQPPKTVRTSTCASTAAMAQPGDAVRLPWPAPAARPAQRPAPSPAAPARLAASRWRHVGRSRASDAGPPRRIDVGTVGTIRRRTDQPAARRRRVGASPGHAARHPTR